MRRASRKEGGKQDRGRECWKAAREDEDEQAEVGGGHGGRRDRGAGWRSGVSSVPRSCRGIKNTLVVTDPTAHLAWGSTVPATSSMLQNLGLALAETVCATPFRKLATRASEYESRHGKLGPWK